ncbi:MAG TPA: DUF2726 domain-containing protein [Nitrospira sp.]|nr:DUF2726 domain-containing protein [Nitrospira sp.]
MEQIMIWTGSGALALFLAWILTRKWRTRQDTSPLFALPPEVALQPQPILTDRQLLLYNLIRLAVEDHYLVFARVPLWSILHLEAQGRWRLQLLRRMALRQVDFLLVHPGSRTAEQVIQLEDDGGNGREDRETQRDIRTMVQAAGLKLTTLPLEASYTVQQLAGILGITESD